MKSEFTQIELAHYSRHFNLPEIGLAGQQRLKEARVLYVGAGGLGSSALLYLVAAGIGTLGIVDDDTVEISNLQRQVLYSYDDIGTKKVEAATKRLQKLNPSIEIKNYALRLSYQNALEIINPYDIVIDGSDNFSTRYLLNDACFHLQKPYIYASISQFEGQCSVFSGGVGPCYRCLFDTPPPPDLIPNCSEGGVLGVLPGIMGSIQATETIKFILNIGKSLIGRLLLFNALEMSFRELNITINPNCRLCQCHQPFDSFATENFSSLSVTEFNEFQKNNNNFFLLDVREPFEYKICNLGGTLIPLKELSSRLSELDKNKHIVVHCKHGGRSQQAADFLRKNGFNKVTNLTGGIIEWIEKIDPTLAKY